jgi:hypothetical protein
MIKRSMSSTTVQTIFFVLIACLLLLPHTGFAASTGQTALFRQWGRARVVSDGDYCKLITVILSKSRPG